MNKDRKQLKTVHFKSLISLKLDNSEAEEKLYKMRGGNLRKFNPYVTFFTMLVAIINSAYQTFIRDEMIKRNETWAYSCLIISYSVTSITFVCLIISIFVKKPSVQMIINCFNYVLITPSLFQIRCILIAMNQADNNVYYSIFVFEFFIRTVWLFTLLILYSEAIFLNILILVCVIVIYPIITQNHSIDNYNVPYNLFIILQIFISYYYTLQVTTIYSYSFNAKKKNKWFSNILENMTSGFVYLKDGCIDYINYSMLEKILKNKEILKLVQKAEISRNQKFNYTNDNLTERDILINAFGIGKNIKTQAIMNVLDNVGISEKIMDILLSDIECDSINFDNIPHILKKTQKFDINKVEEIAKKGFTSKLFFEEFKKKFYLDIINRKDISKIQGYNSNNEENQTFVLLGHKDLEIDIETDEGVITKENLSFEVHCRFYVNSASKQTENIEIIFKDVTITKIVEQKNVEFKLKSLVLAKIAHEFKNPLICITELIDQIYDEMEDDKLNKNKRNKISSSSPNTLMNSNLPMIKSVSNYLLILVKNLDFFSQSGNANASEMRDTNLLEIILFCTQISEGLVKKSNKHNDIKIEVEKDPNMPFLIYSDETKLKQILINLFSNAIKFTNKGFIKLRVSLNEIENLLKFEITDTGPGMRDETKINLFKPFKKSHEKNNIYGAGLGLSIVQDLAKQIGGKLDFISKFGVGTTFSMTIPYTKARTQGVIKCQSSKNIINEIARENDPINSSFTDVTSKPEVNFYNKSITLSINNSIGKSSNNSESKDTIRIDNLNLINFNKSYSDLEEIPKFESENSMQLSTNEKLLFLEIPIEQEEISDNFFLNFKNSDNNIDINFDIDSQINFKSSNNEQMKTNFKPISNINEQQYFINSNITMNINNPIVFVAEPFNEEINLKFNNDLTFSQSELNSIKTRNSLINLENIDFTKEDLTFIIADDEPLARQSTKRYLKMAADKINRKICILESQDGIETLNLVYKSIFNKQKISGIITDEMMKILKGSSAAEILVKLFEIKIDIPLFLVTAYEDKSVINNVKLFNEVFSKPLTVTLAEQIINLSDKYFAE